ANLTGVNFTVVPTTWSLSGTISPAAAGSGAKVKLTGGVTATASADSSGNYTFTGLVNGPYTIAPGKSGYTFNPASRAATINGANLTGIDFTAQTPPAANSITIDERVRRDQ